MTRRAGPTATIIVLCWAAFTAMLLQTVVIPLVPELPTILHTDVVGASWVLTITLLTGAVAHPISGRLADTLGKRRMLLVCLALVGVGAIVSAFSNSLPPMVVGRALQGFGMGILPIGLSVMRDLLPAHRLQSGAGTLSATMGFGGVLAMPLAAWVIAFADWQWVFVLAAVQAVVAAVFVLIFIPPDAKGQVAGTMDYPGAAGFAIGMSAVLIVITQGATFGWRSPLVIGLLAGGVIVLGLWLGYEWRAKDPLVDLRLSFTPAVLWSNVAGFALGYSMFVSNVAFPLLITTPAEVGYGLGLGVASIGVIMVPGGIAMMLAGPLSGRLARRVGGRTTMQIGIAAVVGGYLIFWVSNSIAMFVVALVTFNGGMGLAYAALAVIIMDGAPADRTAAANGLNALLRSVGMAVSSAASAMVLSLQRTSVNGVDFASSTVMSAVLATAWVAGIAALLASFGIPRRGRPPTAAPAEISSPDPAVPYE